MAVVYSYRDSLNPDMPANHRPKFQAKFHVPEEDPDGPWVGP